MDVDLSTDLNALLPLVAPLLSGHSDLAIGSRLARGSRALRGPKRELISRGYNLLLRGALRARFSDAQCGFKAIRSDVARELLPLVEDTAWFFDTELLVLAERANLRIHEVPVDWVDDPDSRVDIWRTARDDVRGIVRLGSALLRGTMPLAEVTERLGRKTPPERTATGTQVALFAMIGVFSTRGVRRAVPPAPHPAQPLPRQRHRAGGHGRGEHRRQPALHLRHPRASPRAAAPAAGAGHLRGGARCHHRLAVAAARDHASPGPFTEMVVLTPANLFVTVMRFVALRLWVFARPPLVEPGGHAGRRPVAAG